MTLLYRVKNLELHLTRGAELVREAQALRYRVFYEELGANGADMKMSASGQGLDTDEFDSIADHLIVTDRSEGSDTGHVVGCYRLQRWSEAKHEQGLYTATEFDLSMLTRSKIRLIEVGRSCVAHGYRSGLVMQLLWRGIAHYVHRYKIGLMIGCASFPGNDIRAIAPALNYLRANHLAPKNMCPRALPGKRAIIPIEVSGADQMVLCQTELPKHLPPLIKAYLRMGATIGDGAIIDPDFNTIDVCIVLPTDKMRARYQRHFMTPGREVDAAAA